MASGVNISDTILGQIVDDTRGIVADRKRSRTVSELESMAGFDRTPASLEKALRQTGLSVIAEIKKASPSKGIIRDPFDPTGIALSYDEGGASALSILTEPLHFQGSPDFLRQVRDTTSLPLLRKDFILDPYQVVEARAWGADAILLIATCLERSQLAELQAAAADYDLDVLLELYDPRELDRVDIDKTTIVGVNSRDLRTFEVDLDGALEVLRSLPDHIVRVAESGLSNLEDFQKVSHANIDAALVGEHFMRADDPGAALKAVLDEVNQGI